MGHAVGSLISWVLVGIGGVFPGWVLKEWGREILFGPRDRAKDEINK